MVDAPATARKTLVGAAVVPSAAVERPAPAAGPAPPSSSFDSLFMAMIFSANWIGCFNVDARRKTWGAKKTKKLRNGV